MKLTIYDTPPSINTYQHKHWGAKKHIKEYWMGMIFDLLNEHGNKCPKHLDHVHVSATITFTTNHRRDAFNYASTLYKFLDDALVYAKVIPDDTAEYITHDEVVLKVGKEKRTEVEIKEGPCLA